MHVRKLKVLIILVAAAVASVAASAAESAVKEGHAIFCLNEQGFDDSGKWIPFIFTPTGRGKVFLSIGRELDPDQKQIVSIYESPGVEVELGANERITVPDSEKVFNRSTWFSLFYTDYRGPTAGFAIRREDLGRRLLHYFESNPKRLPLNGVVKVFVGVQVYRLDCATNDFVKDHVMQSDYLLVKLENGRAEIVGYNFDSFTGEVTGQPITLRRKANAR